MLDKHTVPGATETFRAIAQPLAHHLRADDSFQAQSVSRILSSYAKVGCHCPLVFEAGTKRLAAHMSELKPAFVAELASSLATAGHAEPMFMKRLGGVIKRRFHDYSPSMLCSALWAFSQSCTFHSELFNLSCGKLSNLVSRGQLPYQDISQVCFSFCIRYFITLLVIYMTPCLNSTVFRSLRLVMIQLLTQYCVAGHGKRSCNSVQTQWAVEGCA